MTTSTTIDTPMSAVARPSWRAPSRFFEEHPPPNLEEVIATTQPASRLETVLLALYGYYRQTEPLMTALLRDAPLIPLVAEYLADNMARLNALADALAAGQSEAADRRQLRAAIGHALAFTTWRSLALDQELTDHEAAAMMSVLVRGVG